MLILEVLLLSAASWSWSLAKDGRVSRILTRDLVLRPFLQMLSLARTPVTSVHRSMLNILKKGRCYGTLFGSGLL